jgi:hypothetical protein
MIMSRRFKMSLALRPLKLKLYSGKHIFLVEGPGQGQNPGLQDHGSQILDHAVEFYTPTNLHTKFQLKRCYTGENYVKDVWTGYELKFWFPLDFRSLCSRSLEIQNP